MNEFKESKLIVSQGKKVMQLESLEELVDELFGEQYKDTTQKEKLQQRYKSALLPAILNNMPIVYSEKGIIKKDKTIDNVTPYELEKSFLIDDETTFILSLCKINDLSILEREDANILITEKERERLANKEGNYIFINKIVNEIMERHLQQKREKRREEEIQEH